MGLGGILICIRPAQSCTPAPNSTVPPPLQDGTSTALGWGLLGRVTFWGGLMGDGTWVWQGWGPAREQGKKIFGMGQGEKGLSAVLESPEGTKGFWKGRQVLSEKG